VPWWTLPVVLLVLNLVRVILESFNIFVCFVVARVVEFQI
jgi:hypothetical protein